MKYILGGSFMKYPNAAKGIKKIHTSMLLSIIVALTALVTAVIGVFEYASVDKVLNSSESDLSGLAAFGGLIAIVSIVSLVLLLIAYILNIVGIINASKDEQIFKLALYAEVGMLAVSVIKSFLSGNAFASGILVIVTGLLSVASNIFIIQGVRNLASNIHNYDMNKKGETVFKIVGILLILDFILNSISSFMGGVQMSVVAAVISGISAIISIVAFMIMFNYLSKAKNMLI